jgi:hypothetical protein
MKRKRTKRGHRYEVMASGLIRLPTRVKRRIRQPTALDEQGTSIWPLTEEQMQEMRAKCVAGESAENAEAARKFDELLKKFT